MEKLTRTCAFLIHLVAQIYQTTNFSPTGIEQNEGIANNTKRMDAAGECLDSFGFIKHFLLQVKPSTETAMLEDFCIYFSVVVISIDLLWC